MINQYELCYNHCCYTLPRKMIPSYYHFPFIEDQFAVKRPWVKSHNELSSFLKWQWTYQENWQFLTFSFTIISYWNKYDKMSGESKMPPIWNMPYFLGIIVYNLFAPSCKNPPCLQIKTTMSFTIISLFCGWNKQLKETKQLLCSFRLYLERKEFILFNQYIRVWKDLTNDKNRPDFSYSLSSIQ